MTLARSTDGLVVGANRDTSQCVRCGPFRDLLYPTHRRVAVRLVAVAGNEVEDLLDRSTGEEVTRDSHWHVSESRPGGCVCGSGRARHAEVLAKFVGLIGDTS